MSDLRIGDRVTITAGQAWREGVLTYLNVNDDRCAVEVVEDGGTNTYEGHLSLLWPVRVSA